MLRSRRAPSSRRRGATLIELLVAMALAAIVLAAASATFVRLRRESNAHLSGVRAESQLRTALAELQAVLDGLTYAVGDLTPGQARDTAIQLRAVVGSGVACDSGVARATLATDDTGDLRASGLAVAPRTGDTLWWHVPGSPGWTARRILNVSASVGACGTGVGMHALLRLAFVAPDTVPSGAPLRITRQARYSFYRAGDGTWQLGISEWSEALHAFAAPQPVAGPFTLVSAGGLRTGFRYFDVAGGELRDLGQGIDAMTVARVRVTLMAPDRASGQPVGVLHRDSLDVALDHGT